MICEPVTFAPNRISKPCLVKIFCASLETNLSNIGKNESKASKTTTSEPKRLHTEPNSKPITPAPITPKRLGTSLKAKAPVESTIMSSVKGATGMLIGAEPAAKITAFVAWTVSVAPSCATNCTCLLANKVPVPCNHTIPLPLSNCATPPVNWLTTASLRLCIWAMSMLTLPTLIPCAAKPSLAS